MCVIVHQPVGAYLSKKTAHDMWKQNDDGGGFAYIGEDEKIQAEVHLEFNSFWSSFERARSNNRNTDFLVHMRIATSGKVSLDNCHPFFVDEHTVMAHNGMLNHIVGKIPIEAEKSDTREFIDFVLPELPEDWLDNPVLFNMMEDYIGGSKLMFLTTNPKLARNVYILNEHMGVERHHMWWSNANHEPKKWVSATYGLAPKKEETKETVGSQVALYKLPLPGEPSTASEDYEQWWYESQNMEKIVTTSCETDDMYNWLLEVRKGISLTSGIELDPFTKLYECQRCWFVVDEDTGDCGCWDLLCVECGAMAPYCLHSDEDADLVPLSEAQEAFAQKAAVLAEGAS